MAEYKGMEYLRAKLKCKRRRVQVRYDHYHMKNKIADFGKMIPPDYRWITPVLGWCAKAVDVLADRIVFDGFDGNGFRVNEILTENNSDVLFDSAVISALISSCCFIYISADSEGYPRLQVIDGGSATGIIDPITNLLREGYAVLDTDDRGEPTIEAYFTAKQTEVYRKGEDVLIYENPAPYPLLVPMIYRPDPVRPFGHSRITRACMELVQEALRTLRRSEISAEFYSFPQKYILGLSDSAEQMDKLDKWGATMSSMLAVTRDDDGNNPTVGQFQQQSMTPYSEQLKSIASLFAGETSLTLDDLGFATSNPSSYDAIRASHENLRLTARKAQRTFGTGFLNVVYLAACVRDKAAYTRYAFAGLTPRWLPIFEPDAAALAGVGDAILKINQAAPDYLGEKNIRRLTGMEGENG